MRSARYAALLALALAASSAGATDRVSYPYPGVMHVHREESGLDAHVLTLDLSAGHLDVVSTRPRERSARVSVFAREHRAQIALNANFYEGSPCGLAVGDGVVWRDGHPGHACYASVAFGPRRAGGWRVGVFDSQGWHRANPLAWATQVVTGWPILLLNGGLQMDAREPLGMYRFHPRTALGLAADGHTLVVAVIDGRRPGLPGVTSLELVPLLEEFGARDAVNMDGGGSSELYIEAEGGVVNQPSDHVERPVLNHLGFRVTSAG